MCVYRLLHFINHLQEVLAVFDLEHRFGKPALLAGIVHQMLVVYWWQMLTYTINNMI